jgi:hypothetical protein
MSKLFNQSIPTRKPDGRFRHGRETLVERERRARTLALIATAADVLNLLGESEVQKPPGRPSRFYTPVLNLDTAAEQFLAQWLHMNSPRV